MSMISCAKRFIRPSQWLLNLALLAVVLICLFPVYWTLITSLKGREELYAFNPSLLVRRPTLVNYESLLSYRQTSMLPLNLLNSFKVTLGSIVVQVFIVTLAGYAFARLEFRGRDAIFYFLILTMFIPRAGGLMATFELMHKLGLRNSHLGLILLFPSAVSVALFIMRQAFLAVPRELEESAMIDGANIWRILWYIAIPMVKSAMLVVAIFEFVYVWGEYLITFTLLDRTELYTVSVAVKQVTGWFTLFVSSASYSMYGHDSAAAVVAMTPVILAYVVMQRWFVRGLQEGILKM